VHPVEISKGNRGTSERGLYVFKSPDYLHRLFQFIRG